MTPGPLQDVRILDLTHIWAGPLAVRFLADLGADVVKIEAPYGRGPQDFPYAPLGGWLGGEPGPEPWNANAIFNKLHRNRRAVCLDLKDDRGREVMVDLVRRADVLVENFSAGTLAALGLGADALLEANPRLVYVSMPGFGNTGPYSDRVAFGPVVEGMAGWSAMLGYTPEQPMNTAMALLDPIGGTHAAAAVLAALEARTHSGKGCVVDLSLHEGGVSYNGPWLIDVQQGRTPRAMGNRHPVFTPHDLYPCKGDDQWVAVAVETEQQWQALAPTIALPSDWDGDTRRERAKQIDNAMVSWTRGRDKHSAEAELQALGVPAGAVNDARDLLADEHNVANRFFVPYEVGGTPIPGNPIRFEGEDTTRWQPCPKLGEHNEAVLDDWLGYSRATSQELLEAGVLFNKPPG